MSKSKDLLVDIGVTLVVFTAAVLLLGFTNYRNNQSDLGIKFRQLDASPTLFDQITESSIVFLQSEAEAVAFFPEFDETIDWEKEVVLGYIESFQPTSGYTLKTSTVNKQGQEITVDYQLLLPPVDSTNLTVLTRPTMFIAISKTDLASSSQLTIRFHNETTSQTTSLSISPDEIT
jgi:hypothetical protein